MIPALNYRGGPLATSGRVGPESVWRGAAAGRPKSRGKFALRPVDKNQAGFEMLNTAPAVLQSVHRQYMAKGELPPGFRTPNTLPRPLQDRKNRAISQGFAKPRGAR